MTPRPRAAWIMAVALVMVAGLAAAPPQTATAERQLEAAIHREQVLGDVKGAIEQYKTLAQGANRAVAAQALVHLGQCYEKLGETQAREARATYERVVRDYADQADAAKAAQARLSALTAGGGTPPARTEVAAHRLYVGEPGDEPITISPLSPDGRYVIFDRSDSGSYWLRDLQTGERRRIPANVKGMPISNAEVSPDGRLIARTWMLTGNITEIRVSGLDGSSERAIYRSPAKGVLVIAGAWMPDNRHVLVHSYHVAARTGRRYIVAIQDGSAREVGQPEQANGVGHWGLPSPDGSYIVYDLQGDIVIDNAATLQEAPLIQHPARERPVGWTQDGTGLLFASDRSGTMDLYLQNVENGAPKGDPKMLRREFHSGGASITRDGRLAWFETKGGDESFTIPIDKQSGELMGSASPINRDGFPKIVKPGWSADGKLFFYRISRADGTSALMVRSEETGQTREVVLNPPLADWANPVSSPDGRQVLVVGGLTRKDRGVMVVDAATGAARELVKLPSPSPVDPVPNWSPDGAAVIYKVTAPDKGTDFILKRKNLSTGQESDVFRGFHTREMRLSPDGTRLAYVRTDRDTNSQVLGVLDLQSGRELEVWRLGLTEGAPVGAQGIDTLPIKSPAWTPDGRFLLVGRDMKPGTELWRFPATGGQGERLHFFPELTWGFVVHPGGAEMAFTQRRTTWELWVLENLLPPVKAAGR
jgi:Tol biopolymer transport system component